MKILTLQQAGDTIVEVSICITIAVLALVGGLLSVNQSLRNTRQSQERSEAVKIAQQQIEQSRTHPGDPAPNFCIKNGEIVAWGTNAATPPPDHDQDNFVNYPAECKPDGDNLYYIWISSEQRSPGISLLTVHVRWAKLGLAEGNNQVHLLATQITTSN